MYSLFDLDIGAVIRESADRIIETLNIQAGTDRTDDERVDSDDESTLDFIEVEVVEWSREKCVKLNFWEESELLILIEAYFCS
jgi:hypothetical protein